MKRPHQFSLASILFLAFTAALSGCGGNSMPSYTLNITIENGPGCSVAPTSGTTYPEGTVVTLIPTGATGYALDHWGGTDGPEVTIEDTIVMDGDKNIAAVFARLQYDLDVISADSAAGSVLVRIVPPDKASHSIEHGQTVELTAKPNPGHLFDHWEGGLTGGGNPAVLTLTGPLSVTAYFTPGIKGRVFRQNSLQGAAGITVTAGGLTAVTDADGRWEIRNASLSLPVTVTPSVSIASGYLGVAFSPAAVTIYPFYPVSADDIQIAFSAYVFEKAWGGPGVGDGQFKRPCGTAVNAAGYIYVADLDNNRIQKFTAAGGYEAQWGGYGSGNGQFWKPLGVAVDADGYVYVADVLNHRIQKFTADGGYEDQWGGYGSGNGQLRNPYDVAVDAAGYIYVADQDNNRIQKFTAAGGYEDQWGGYGSGDGQFRAPMGVAVDADGHVYVADLFNHRIQKFTADGDYVAQWGGYGSGDGQFNEPGGIAVDAAGHIYVVDTKNHRIQKFTAGGVYLAQWGGYGSGDGQFNLPYEAAVDADGHVYVSDMENSRIQKFRLVD